MRNWLLGCCLLAGSGVSAQQLTVPLIMRDPKWIGTSPSGVYWSPDSKEVFFSWNPTGAPADSAYVTNLAVGGPRKVDYRDAAISRAQRRGTYNKAHTLLAYSFESDLYLTDLKTGKTRRLTHTLEGKYNPQFCLHDSCIVYQSGDNLFAYHMAEGYLEQWTDFEKGGETSSVTGPRGRGRGGRTVGSSEEGASQVNPQEKWLKTQQLELMEVLKERHDKKEAAIAYNKAVKETDTLKVIHLGDKSLNEISPSPSGRFIVFSLYKDPTGIKNTIVPSYVTESGFTTDIPGREKVGVAQGENTLFVYDRVSDTVMQVKTDSIEDISKEPEYLVDYPSEHKEKPGPRPVSFDGPYWNEDGSAAFVDIRSQDFKDRWIMLLDLSSGKLQLIDHQHDSAWIGGPGIGWGPEGEGKGWLNASTVWFQSEATGYSHLYTYDLKIGKKNALTTGNYEVLQSRLSKDKKYFYLLTNQEHPGKQNWYRLNVTGGNPEKITTMTGAYQVALSPDEKYIAYLYSYINKPDELYVQENAPGKQMNQITNKATSTEFQAYPWRNTRIFTIKARDGKEVYARIYDPAPGKKNGAAVIFVHGAGYLQNVDYGWSEHYFREYMFNNLLADEGYTVLEVDYRASSGYGRDWRTAIYRHMGGKDLDDEVDAARYLVREQGIDSSRIGIYGGSYGGFMTLMAMFTAPTVFKAGAALRSVTDWAAYNHGYTAEILNEPFTDSLAYRRSSPIYFASGLQGHLLICHGMVDENVHFQDDVRLAQRLIELGKDNWELAVYPMEDHGFVEPSSWTDEYKRIKKLFDTWLLK
jgi:dipeptidyl aminopeptidase/acylaminoacyl peptidase